MDKYVVPKLSHHSVGALVKKKNFFLSSFKRDFIYKISQVVLATDLYSASVEDLATVGCFLDPYEIRCEPK